VPRRAGKRRILISLNRAEQPTDPLVGLGLYFSFERSKLQVLESMDAYPAPNTDAKPPDGADSGSSCGEVFKRSRFLL
jgi:hypothetical protein